MAKRKSESDSTEAIDVSPFADSLEEPSFVDEQPTAPPAPVGLDPVGEAVTAPLFIPGEDEQNVSLTLPRAVLYALLDPKFEEADVNRAVYLGLLSPVVDGGLTELGQRVLAGTDATALWHKINTGYRIAHNRLIDAKPSTVTEQS